MTRWINGEEQPGTLILSTVVEIKNHHHNLERWFGKTAGQTATDWGTAATLTPYVAISGAGVFGADADDEAQVLGTADTPVRAGMTRFDIHRIMVSAAGNANPFVLRVIQGTGTMAAAEAAGEYTDVMITEARTGGPIEIRDAPEASGTKVWIRAKNAANNATIDFFVGIHEYEE